MKPFKILIAVLMIVTLQTLHFGFDRTASHEFAAFDIDQIKQSDQLRHLSSHEMKESKGHFWPIVYRFGYGALGGSVGYTTNYWSNRMNGNHSPWRWSAFGTAAIGGGVSSFISWNPWWSASLGSATGSFISSYSWGW